MHLLHYIYKFQTFFYVDRAIFTTLITNNLDKVAPFGTITIRSNFKFGLSEDTKELMKTREKARRMIKISSGTQKQIWNEKYKKLRNAVTYYFS